MAIGENRVRIQTIVDRELAERLDDLAARMNLSQSRMAALLIEAAIEDEGWIIKFMTSKFTKSVMKAFGKKPRTTVLRDEEGR